MKFLIPFVLFFTLSVPAPVGGEYVAGQLVDGEEIDYNSAKLVIDIQETCEVGELVRMDASSSDIGGIKWEVRPETPDFEVIEDGRRAFFSSRHPGEYLIVVAAAKDDKPFLHFQTLTVKGEPIPVSELTRKVGEWAARLPEDIDRNKFAQMAAVFRKLANSEIEFEKMLEATALANSAILGESLEKWVPFLDSLGSELDRMVTEGKLATAEQYRATWLEIAAALDRQVK